MARPHGFPRHERLTRTADMDRVFRKGTGRRGERMTVLVAANELPHSRLGIALRRGWRGAVARNRAKRLVREAFRTRKHELPRGLDIVVIPATNWREPHVAEIALELMRLVGDATGGRP